MTRTRRPFLAALTLALALGALGTGAVTHAAPPPIADGMCSLLMPAEIDVRFPGGTWQVADDGETADECFLHNGRFDQAAASLIVKVVPSSAEGADGFFADLVAAGGAAELSVAGVPAIFVRAAEGGSLYVRAGDDWWFTVETTSTAKGLGDALIALGTIVAGRLGVGGATASAAPGTPAGTELCSIVTLEEVAAALGEPLTATTDGRDDCVLAGDPAAGTGANLTLAYRVGDLTTTATLEDQARQAFPDAPAGLVLGVEALFPAVETTDTGLARASVQLLPDPQTWIAVSADAPEGIDAPAAVLAIAEAVLTRLGMATGETIVPGASPEPGASPAPSGDLASLFPADIGGSPVTIQLNQSLSLMNLPAALQKKLVKALRAQGVSLDDATIAAGGPADGSAGIVAIRVPGADIRKLGPVLVQAIGGRMLKGEPSPAVVGAREAFLIQDSGGTTGYAHPSGDVLWMVFGQTETGIAIAFAALP